MSAERPCVFIPEPLEPAAVDLLRPIAEVREGAAGRRYSEDELIDELAGVDAIIITSREQMTRRVIEGANRLRLITKSGARPSNVDFAAATERGILITWTPGANAVSVAEFTMGLLLAAARRLPTLREHLQRGGWRRFELLGTELDGKTLGLVGFGAIGVAVALRARAFGLRVLAFDPVVPPARMAESGAEARALPDVIAESDFLSIHCDLTPATRHLIGEAEFRRMKPTAILLNTARGPIVDEAALFRALTSGEIAGAGLDVFAVEPPVDGSPLFSLENVIATPHVAAYTTEAIGRESRWAVEDVVAVLSGRTPIHWRPLDGPRAVSPS